MTAEHLTRRRLPHRYVPAAAQVITFRLANTLPAHVAVELRVKQQTLLARKPLSEQTPDSLHHIHQQVFAVNDDWLDQLTHVRWLREPAVVAIVRDAPYYHDRQTFRWLSYCAMPNHVHILVQPQSPSTRCSPFAAGGEAADRDSPLKHILHSIKSFTAHEANKVLQRQGAFWQRESYDHWVRDDEELERIVA